jgi:Tol biopolymer transport system component
MNLQSSLRRLLWVLIVAACSGCSTEPLVPEAGSIHYTLLYQNEYGEKSDIIFELLPTSGDVPQPLLSQPIQAISGWQTSTTYYWPPCPRWTLDKHYVVFNNGPNITIYDFLEAEFETVELNFAIVRDVAWSPDNSKLAFSGNPEVGKTTIWLFDRTSEELTHLVECDHCLSPIWKFDGKALAYIHNSSPPAIEVFDFAKGQVTEKFILSDELGFVREGAPLLDWSPRENKLVFIANKDSKRHLFILDLELGQVEQITLRQENIDSPTWSPSGEQILYRSKLLIEPVLPGEDPTEEITNLLITSLNGAKQLEVTNHSATRPTIICPQWLPVD